MNNTNDIMGISGSNSTVDVGKVQEVAPGRFEAPDLIIRGVATARQMYETLRICHIPRMLLYRAIHGLIAGNPPYPPKELKSAGLSHIANFNDMSPRAIIKRGCLAYWNLLYNAEHLTHWFIRNKDPQAPFYATKLAEHWDYVVYKQWPTIRINIARLTRQMVELGVSPVLFSDERSPIWDVIQINKFFVPDQTQSNLDKITTIFVESEFTLQYLWGIYREFADKPEGSSPWNVKQLGKLLAMKSTAPNRDAMVNDDLVEQAKRILAGDVSMNRMYNDCIKVVSCLQQEFSGKISHYMFHRDMVAYPAAAQFQEGFLFIKPEQYESMQEAVVIFTINPGEDTIHENKGLGHEIYSLAQAAVMLDCKVVDMATWASTVLVKSPSLTSKDVEQLRFYPGVPTNLGQAEFVENTMGDNISNVIAAANFIANKIQYNLTYSGDDPAQPDPDQGSLSPIQTKLQAFNEFSIMKNAVLHFYSTFDVVLQRMSKRMWNSKRGYPYFDMADEWKRRCIEDGVPPQLFEGEMPDVYATRVAGAGSQVQHLMGLQGLHQFASGFGPREQKEFLRHAISATIGPEYIQSFMQDSEDPDETAGGASVAGLENAVMQLGKSPIFSTDNEQRSHMVVHMALGKELIQQIEQQQLDPVSADKIFSMLIPHGDQHLQALSQNSFAADLYAKVAPLWKQIRDYAVLNRKNAEKMVRAQQQQQAQSQDGQQQAMTDAQRKDFVVQHDEQIKDTKLQHQMSRQDEMNAAKQKMAQDKVTGELAIKREEAQGNVEVKKIQKGADSTNTAVDQANANPSQYLSDMQGSTPSPSDFEVPS